MRERTRRIDAEANRESDGVIVPEKQPNRGTPVSTEAVEGRALAKRNTGKEATIRIQSRDKVSFGLEGVRRRAKTDKTCCFTALLHHITPELLRQSFYELNRKAMPGIDGVTWQDYEKQLEERLPNLHTEIHKGSYRAKPVLRTYIPKADGQQRPLGVTAIEDKLVQQAVVNVLTPVYETEFYGFSYGYRPGRSQHGALDALATAILTRRINWILDADLQGFFDSILHEPLLEFIKNRKGGYFLKRKTVSKRLRQTIGEIKEALRKKMHDPVEQTGNWLKSVVQGYGLYFGVPGNIKALKSFRDLVTKAWYRSLRRRSQKGTAMTWQRFTPIVDAYFPRLRICHEFPEVRFAITQGKSRMR